MVGPVELPPSSSAICQVNHNQLRILHISYPRNTGAYRGQKKDFTPIFAEL